jgi:23S rRNA G2069 N7-methylase RlmK/C1962 C5-methylase RlmI
MDICKKFANSPKTIKKLHKIYKPIMKKAAKYFKEKGITTKNIKKTIKNIEKFRIEKAKTMFMKKCNETCKEFKNTPVPCGKKNEQLWLKNLSTIIGPFY